jgi:hypothetical protein
VACFQSTRSALDQHFLEKISAQNDARNGGFTRISYRKRYDRSQIRIALENISKCNNTGEGSRGRQPHLPPWCSPAPEKDEPAYGDRRARTYPIEHRGCPFGLCLCDDLSRGEEDDTEVYHPNNELWVKDF